MFARDDREGVNELYWRTAMWIAVLSFPIFALTCSLAAPTTLLLLGERYRDSATLLALLAVGYYFNAALGFNGLTLKIYGRVRYVVLISLVTVLIGGVASLALIPLYGALGAAIATCLAMVVHNVLKQAGLRLGTGIDVFARDYVRGYAVIGLSAAGVWGLARFADVPFYLAPIVAGLGSWLVFRCNRHLLDLEGTFPEVRRVPLVRRLVGAAERA
jgi:O-antigen/teichoic acid export membrane protein